MMGLFSICQLFIFVQVLFISATVLFVYCEAVMAAITPDNGLNILLNMFANERLKVATELSSSQCYIISH